VSACRHHDFAEPAVCLDLKTKSGEPFASPVAEIRRCSTACQALPLTFAPVRQYQVGHLQGMLSGAMRTASKIVVPMPYPISLVVRTGAPVQIRQHVIATNSVPVAGLKAWSGRADESPKNQVMDQARTRAGIEAKRVLNIAILPSRRHEKLPTKCSSAAMRAANLPLQRSSSPLVGNLVTSDVSRDRSPLLGLFIHGVHCNRRME